MGAAITTPLPEKPEDEEQKDVGSIKEVRNDPAAKQINVDFRLSKDD